MGGDRMESRVNRSPDAVPLVSGQLAGCSDRLSPSGTPHTPEQNVSTGGQVVSVLFGDMMTAHGVANANGIMLGVGERFRRQREGAML
jgi:hypothetical protein